MRRTAIITTILSLFFFHSTFAVASPMPVAGFKKTAETVSFSPYADMTINTHWDPKYQDMEPMNLYAISQKSGIKDYHLAFITDSNICAPAWGGQSSYSTSNEWGSHLINLLKKNHIHYAISFGGANGSDISMNCTEPQLVQAYEQIIKTYQPESLDFDIENSLVNVPNLMQALSQIQKNYPDLKLSFTLPVLPEGLVSAGQMVLKEAQAQNLNYSINIMAMDYGPAYTGDMGDYAIQAAENVYNFLKQLYPARSGKSLWHMIQVTPMIGVNDVNAEHFTQKDAQKLAEFSLNSEHRLGGLAMWAVARDNPCSNPWASPVCSGADMQSAPYEYARDFISALGISQKLQ